METTINQVASFNSKLINEIDDWIAYDFEWIVVKNCSKFRLFKIDKNTSDASMPPIFGNEKEYSKIVTFSFEDNNGNKGSFDITDYSSSKEFLEAVKEKLLQYKYCFAWGSKAVVRKNRKTGDQEGINGDLVVLDSNFKANKIPSIVSYDKYSNIPFLKKDIFTAIKSPLKADIDLLKVFAKPLVKSSHLKNKYRSPHLEDVCKGVLGFGKIDNKTGAKLEEMSIEERKSYCLQDAHLVAELVRLDNGDILKIMQVISFHTGLMFEEVCHKGMPGIWKKNMDKSISKKISIVGYENIPTVLRKLYSNNRTFEKYVDYFGENEYDAEDEEDEELLEYKENSYDHYIDLLDQKSRNKNSETEESYSDVTYSNNIIENDEKPRINKKYKGGMVLDPLRGLHQDVYLADVTSLYPTMIINNNISPETVNCSCCKNNIQARMVFDKSVSDDLRHGNVINDNKMIYWICPYKKGLFSKKLEELTQKRIQYKNEGKELESTAIKVIINSGYGLFGDPNFKYYDPKVAEVITALGRQTLLDMKKIAEEMKFTVLYGDTDSLFVNNIDNN